MASYWNIFVVNPDILCAKIWRGREGEDNSDEVPSPGLGSSNDHCDLSSQIASNELSLRLIQNNFRRPGVSRRLGVSRGPGVSRRLGVSPPRPFSWFGVQQWPMWSIKSNWLSLRLLQNNFRRPGVSRRLGVSRRPGVSGVSRCPASPIA